MKRKPIKKSVRFEVFKRDSFTCQYCGRSAPEVVLEIDHIKPHSAGGKDDIMNLVTSCFDCNRGKGAKELDDKTAIEKQKAQLDELNKKREQLEMMIRWREELNKINDTSVNYLIKRVHSISGYELNSNGINKLKRWSDKFSFNEISNAVEASFNQYFMDNTDSFNKAFNYIPRIVVCSRKEKENPSLKDLYYIRGILRNRLSYINERDAIRMLKDAHSDCGAEIDELKDMALSVRNWTKFKEAMFSQYGVE